MLLLRRFQITRTAIRIPFRALSSEVPADASNISSGTQTISSESPKKKPKIKNVELVSPLQAIRNLKNNPVKRHFDETFEFCLNLNVDPRKQDQQVRVIADLPHGTGKLVRVVGFTANEDQAKAALQAGCDIVGGSELIKDIAQTQTINFDKAVATEDILPELSKIARLLGPKGLMPSKKLGTVVSNLEQGVLRAKAGSIELRADRGGTVHCGFGKLSMPEAVLMKNLKSIILCLENNKPTALKGKKWVKSAFLTTTMGPSYPINLIYLDPKHARFFAEE